MKGKSGKRRRRAAPRTLIWVVLAGLLLITAAVGLALGAGRKPTARATPEVTGAPGLNVSPAKVDLGNIQLGRQVQVDIELTNVGDQPLRLSQAPWVEVVEGCCPPTPTIGSMVLQPGERTTVSIIFMMHADMGGPHDFRLHIASNDPAGADKTVDVLSNWVP